MKRIKWHLLLIAAFGICAGYVNKPPNLRNAKSPEMDTYQYLYTSWGKMYFGYDLSTMGYVQGIDYDCIYPPNTCTFIANPLSAHFDASGSYFYTTDVPQPGINNDGAFELLDY